MSLPPRRLIPVLFVACAAFLAIGCSSNNTGKIEGKWKSTSLPEPADERERELRKQTKDAALVFEFTANGKMTTTATATVGGVPMSEEVMSADYKLGSGDWVFFSNIKSKKNDGKTKSKEKIVITGDTLTIDTDKGGKLTFARMK